MERYNIRVTGDNLTFSAAHFISPNDEVCEGLHGHDYRVAAEVHGPLNQNHYVVDFIAVRNMLQAIIRELDHRMLLPGEHATVCLNTDDREIEVRLADRRWVFPRTDCLVLPVADTTAELIARYVAHRLLEKLQSATGMRPMSVRVELAEGPNFSAVCEVG